MVIFVVAALAGFLLFGWFQYTQRTRPLFLNPDVQGRLGLRILCVLLLILLVLMFPSVGRILPGDWWSEYLAVRIIRDLTGTEAAQLILGMAFGCILRYWGTDLWAVTINTSSKSNWMAISLVGLLLLAAAVPYIGNLLKDWGVKSLKTPVAEFQIVGTTNVDHVSFEKEPTYYSAVRIPYLITIPRRITKDVEYLELSRWAIEKKITDLSDEEERERLDKIKEFKKTYNATRVFIENFLIPFNQCALQAKNNNLDIESVRHALSPVAQQLRLLIQGSSPQNLASPEKLSVDNLLTKIEKSVNRIRESFSQDKKLPRKEIEDIEENVNVLIEISVRGKSLLLKKVEKSSYLLKEAVGEEKKETCTLKFQLEEEKVPDDLTHAPHIYLVLASLDAFNDNRDGGIFILESALERFDKDRNLSPGILFNIHFTLARYLYFSKADSKSIFLHLDEALKIAQATLNTITEWKQRTKLSAKRYRIVEDAEKRFEYAEAIAKNELAYISAEEGVRKFEALRYAKHNYDHSDNLSYDHSNNLSRWLKPQFIDTYGYVKMAFEARKKEPNFDEIKEARALFKEAISHAENLPDSPDKTLVMKLLRAHIEKADKRLEYQ